MAEAFRSLGAWIKFAGFVLIVVVLNWAETVLVPLCLAILITFVLTPPVRWLQARIGRGAAVLTIAIFVFTLLGLGSYGVYRQMTGLVDTLPTYGSNIRAKIRDVRGAQAGGSVEKLSKTFEEIKGEMGSSPPPRPGTPREPVVVSSETAGLWPWVSTFLQPLGTAGFVITLVIFMLLDRERLRDRLVGLFGHGRLAQTTKAMDEAGQRVSRQLLLQTLVNATYGVLALVGLYLLGVPYPLFWGMVGAVLRFIPYVGPVVAAGGPILLAFAALPGWVGPLEVVGFYIALELFTNLVLETVLYADAAGVSQVALLVAVAFWTWLWGPLGLMMATPLTVCIIVIGKHVPGLEFLGTLLSDAPALTAETRYYQRLLARDEAEAAELLETHAQSEPAETVYDRILIPALNFAERDRLEGRLSPDEEGAVVETTSEMLEMLGESGQPPLLPAQDHLRVLGYAANGMPDELALRMLRQLLGPLPVVLEPASSRLLASELVNHVRKHGYTAVCIADLPPSTPSKTRYLVKKLRAAVPDLRIAVGRWSSEELADETLQPITEAGASHVASSLLETRRFLADCAQAVGPAASARSDAA